jgi:uncharacterized caspase-like protein
LSCCEANRLDTAPENDPEAIIFIYYSGHGCLDASGDYYFIPHETDRTDITDTALPATKFNAALQEIPAKQLLVIIDSCHAQGMASSKEGANCRLVDNLTLLYCDRNLKIKHIDLSHQLNGALRRTEIVT